MKKIIILILLCLCVFPNTIKAGIICNDGWESSCPFPGPGCCSHHGGIPGGSDYSNGYSGGEGFGGLILIGFCFIAVIGIYQTIKEKNEQRIEIENQVREKEEIKEYYLDMLSRKWKKYLKEKEEGFGLYKFEKKISKKEKIEFLKKEKEINYKKLQDSIKKYNISLQMIKTISDDKLNDFGKQDKQNAKDSYNNIFYYIYVLGVINDRLSDLDKSIDYLSFTRYKNQLFKEFGVFDELLSKYRS